MWIAAFTGTRRSELLGLKWTDLDIKRSTLSINRGRVDICYQVVETPDITPQIGASRGKTRSARRRIDLDPTTIDVLTAWQTWQATERAASGLDATEWMFTDLHGEPIHPQTMSQTFERMARRAPSRSSGSTIQPHPRHPAHRRGRSCEGRQRTTRTLPRQLHHRQLPARPARRASRSRRHLRGPHRESDFYRRHPVEDPEEDGLKW